MKLIKASSLAVALSMGLIASGIQASSMPSISVYDVNQSELGNLPKELARAIQNKDTKAVNELLKAGHIETHLYLAGYHLSTGVSSADHIERSFELVQAAALAGDKDALRILGEMYYRGIGTNVNYAAAFDIKLELLKPTATLEQAIYFSQIYLNGNEFLTPNFNKAEFWLKLASEMGDLDSTLKLANYYEIDSPTPDQDLAILYRERAAKMGDVDSQYLVAIAYLNAGMDEEALHWFAISSKNGTPAARLNEGLIYLQSDVVGQDIIKAYVIINDAVAMGSAEAKLIRKQIERTMTDEQFEEARDAVRAFMQSRML